MNNYEVISAFIDDEPFDPAELKQALAEPGGRDLLIDLVALRQLAQPEAAMLVASTVRKRPRASLWAVAAASILFSALGGYHLGSRRDARSAAPPEPTVVVKATGWQQFPAGGGR